MSSTTFELTVDRAMTPDEQEHLHKVLELIAVAHGMLLSSTVVEPKFTYKVEQDRWPVNPREDDNVGVMFCSHGRYRLGDKDADDPFISYGFIDLGGYKLGLESDGYDDDAPKDMVLFSEVRDMLYEIFGDVVDDVDYGDEDTDTLAVPDDVALTIDWLDSLPYRRERVLRDDLAVCLPLYLYDHSGITISHGSFSCPWDSGQVGWHYITKEAADDNWPAWTEDSLNSCLEAELKNYDDYLRGNVWGYVIENENGDVVDSCSGFYGDALEETGMLDYVLSEHHEGIGDAWERRFDR